MDDLIRFDALRAVLSRYADEVLSKYKAVLKEKDAVASGKLINRVNYQIKEGDHTFEVSLKLQDYWKYLEYGTKPHWPPVNKILEWIKVKPVIPRPLSNGKLPTQQQLAFLIGRKISIFGTEAKHMLRDTLDSLNDYYKAEIEKALSEDVKRSLVIFR